MRWTCFILSLFVTTPVFGTSEDQLTIFDQTTSLVTQNFYDQTFRGLDWPGRVLEYRSRITSKSSDEKLEEVLNDLLNTLKASHTKFLSSSDQEYWALQSVFSGDIDGAPTRQIGAWFAPIRGKWFVKNVFEGGPAQKAGLLPGDEIVSADGAVFSPVDTFADQKTASLWIRRSQAERPFQVEVPIVRESFQRTLLRASKSSFQIYPLGKKRIAYIHLWSGTHDSFKKSLASAAKNAARTADAFILDLRDGFGGANPEYLEPFLPSSQGAPSTYDKPLLVLINDGVRSGKEWITHILKETKRATLVGTRTKGYFLAGKLFDVRKGRFSLYLAVNEDPSMPKIEGNGIWPDIEVPFELPYSGGDDPVLRKALQILGPQ